MRAQKRKRQYRKENQFLELRLEKILDLIYPVGLLTWRYRVIPYEVASASGRHAAPSCGVRHGTDHRIG